jgi:signal peptidase II
MIRLAAALIFADQITKAFVPRDFLERNFGLPFGFDFGNYNLVLLFLAAISLLSYFLKVRSSLNRISLFAFALIFSGATSNLIDRLLLGYVRDYLNLGITTLNMADLFILAGLIILIIKPIQDK